MVTLRVLGGFALLDDRGEPLKSLPQRRAEATLALLAICGDLGCTRDRMSALLWPDSSEALARHSLRSALHALRLVAGADAISATGDSLWLNAAIVPSDVDAFARALHAGALADAVDTYTGALLDGFHVDAAPEFERCVEDERARLYRRCADAIDTLARRAESRADTASCIAWRQRAVDHDPHNTRLVVQLMRSMATANDPANALLQAELHRRRLWSELEIEPDDELAAEEAHIRAMHPRAVGASRRAPSPSAGVPIVPVSGLPDAHQHRASELTPASEWAVQAGSADGADDST